MECHWYGCHAQVIDAKHVGGVARFINHCCDPNLVVQNVLAGHSDERLTRVGFVRSSHSVPSLSWTVRDLTIELGLLPTVCAARHRSYAGTVVRLWRNHQRKAQCVSMWFRELPRKVSVENNRMQQLSYGRSPSQVIITVHCFDIITVWNVAHGVDELNR